MTRLPRPLALAVLLAALVAAPVAAPAQAPNSLVIQVPTEPPGLDLTSNPSSAIAAVVFDNVQEGLIKIDRHGKMVPWLAERWYTSDNKNYTFFLRRNVRFSNGREMKSSDVKFALDRAVNPETKHPYRVQYDAIKDVIVKDDYTVTVALKKVDATFLYTLARQGSVIYPRESVDTLKSQPIGTGPFTVSEWVRGDRIVLLKNKDYWVKGLPKLDRVVYRFIPDPNSTLAAIKSGDIDVSAFGIGPESVDELKKDPRLQVIVGDTTNDVTLSMNNSKKPYSDKRVRLAITHAINKEEVLKGAMFGYGKILGSNVDPTNPFFVDVSKRVGYDPARAKKLLAEAGYPNGFDAVFKVAPQYYYTVRSAEIVSSQLAKVGIRATIQQIEWGQWLSQVFCLAPCQNPDYDMSIIGHAEAWDIGNFANPKYYFRWDNPEFQKLYAESQVTMDEKARRALFVKMQEMLADEAPAVWLFMHPRLVVTKKGVTGLWKDQPAPVLDLSEVAWQR
ncbi:MAG TPA: ABC transporter substrate-binding protein [Methylomirabilota bacterium]|nr:ABC transporter substrate-binding protein [Methylomirabilota bacterium]